MAEKLQDKFDQDFRRQIFPPETAYSPMPQSQPKNSSIASETKKEVKKSEKSETKKSKHLKKPNESTAIHHSDGNQSSAPSTPSSTITHSQIVSTLKYM